MRMFRSIFLPSIIIVLLIGFWYSPDFKTIAAGVSIFLFGMYFLERGFNAFTGGLLEKLLAATTDKLWKSIGFGLANYNPNIKIVNLVDDLIECLYICKGHYRTGESA